MRNVGLNNIMSNSSRKILSFVTTGAFALAPMLALGAGTVASFGAGTTYVNAVVDVVKNTVNALIPIMIGLTFIYFAWCMIAYIRSEGADKEKNKSSLIWSVIAIVLVVSIWGLANLLQSIFGATDPTINPITVPII